MSRKTSENLVADDVTENTLIPDEKTENAVEVTTDEAKETVNKVVEETPVKATVKAAKEPKMGIYQYLLRYKVENEQIGNLMRVLYKRELHTASEWRAMYEKLCSQKITSAKLAKKY